MKWLISFIIVLSAILFNPVLIFADFTFTSPIGTIMSDQEVDLTVNLSLSGQANSVYYLEGAFKADGGSNYFGLTEGDSGWVRYTSSNYQSLKKVNTDADGKWLGSLKVKIDPASSLYKGSGGYSFQVKRFTSSGSSSWSDNSVSFTVTDNGTPSPDPSTSSSPSSSADPGVSSGHGGFTIDAIPSSLNSGDSFNVKVNISGLSANTKYYLKGAFAKSGSTNYFGRTMVGGGWVKNGESATSQFPITTDATGDFSGELTVSDDSTDSGFTGTGGYIFKVGRYNSTGSSLTWSNELNMTVVGSATSSSTGTSGSSSKASPKPSSSAPLAKASSTNVTLAASGVSKSFNGEGLVKIPDIASESGQVGDSKVKGLALEKSNPFINWWYIGAGLGLVAAAGVSVVYFYRRNR